MGLMAGPRTYSSLIKRLQDSGLRPTRPRLALAKLLFEKGNRHLSAEQLHAEVISAKVRVSLATVYNTLHQFTTAGLLREVVVDSGPSYFDTNVENHHHFYFEDSHSLQDIPGDHVRFDALPPPPMGTEISRVDVMIRIAGKKA